MSSPPSVFISYSHADGRGYAYAVYEGLRAAGMEAWLDQEDARVTPLAEIEQAIRGCTHVVVCVTPSVETRADSFVRHEILFAQEHGKPILPLVFDGATVPLPINTLKRIAVRDVAADLGGVLQWVRTPAGPARFGTDPHREYLLALLEQIEGFLGDTTFALLPLRTRDDPSAVAPAAPRAPVRIVSRSLVMREDAAPPAPREEFDDFQAAFQRYSGSVLLLGEPGAGKSTTLWMFARHAVLRRLKDPSQPLPVLAQIPSWDPHAQPDLVEWLSANVRGLDRDTLARGVDSGGVLLLLDALDELGSRRVDPGGRTEYDPRSRFARLLPPGAPLVVTCRVTDYEDMGERLPLNGAVVLEPLEDAQIELYLRGQPQVWSVIQRDAALRAAVRTPLVLSLFTYAVAGLGPEAVGLQGLGNEELRDRVFDLYLRRRYEHEALKPRADLPFTREHVMAVLGRLAVASTEFHPGAGPATVDADDAARALHPHLPGLWLRLRRNRRRAAAFLHFAERLHALLPNADGTHRFLHLLLRDSLAYRTAVEMTRHWSRDVRARGASALGPLHDTRTVPALLESMQDPDEWVRHAAAHAFGWLYDDNRTETFLDWAQNRDSRLRESAAIAMRRSRDERVSPLLIALLGDQSAGVRRRAAEALGDQGDAGAVAPLIDRLEDSDSFVRAGAADALGKLGDRRAVPVLIGRLKSRDYWERRAAAAALGRLGDREAVMPLVERLKDADSRVVATASRALARLNDSRGFEALARMLRSRDHFQRSVAALWLGHSGDPRALPLLMTAAAAREHSKSVRYAAIASLGRLRAPEALDVLIAALDDEEPRVRFEAALALGDLGDARAVPRLLSRLDDRETTYWHKRVGEAAAIALVQIGTPEARAAVERSPYPPLWGDEFPPYWLLTRNAPDE